MVMRHISISKYTFVILIKGNRIDKHRDFHRQFAVKNSTCCDFFMKKSHHSVSHNDNILDIAVLYDDMHVITRFFFFFKLFSDVSIDLDV